ncbi:hypothetical protein PG987_015771 [Apiospora arundinis]
MTESPLPVMIRARVGKSSSALCQEGSAFKSYSSACKSCLQAHQTSPESLGPYLTYCDIEEPSTTITLRPTTTHTFSSELPDTGTLAPSRLITYKIEITTVLGGHSTVLSQQTVYPSYAAVARTTVATKADTLGDGRPTVWSITVTYSDIPKSLFGDIVSTTSNGGISCQPSDTPASGPPTQAATQNMAWVAGPIIGGVTFMAILIVFGYLWRRRRRQRTLSATAAGTAPEIDGKERLEIDGKSLKPELAGSRPDVDAHGTNQHPIQELEAGGPYRDGRHQRDT